MIINLHNVFHYLLNDKSLKIVLANIENDLPVSWKCFMPNDKAPSNELLNDKSSLFAQCARRKRPVYIDNIATHTKKKSKLKYKSTQLDNDNDGSIICHPVFHSHFSKIIYVISFKSSSPYLMTEGIYKKHQYIIEAFSNRLILEYTLDFIKGRAV